MPLYRRLPKRGFKNIFAKRYAEVNLKTLEERFEDGAEIDAVRLVERGILKKVLSGVKIMGDGELSKKFKVRAQKFTASAKGKIELAGGVAEVI